MAISVTNPIDKAMKRTKKVLFAPFEAGVWFKLGFCAFLANLGQSGPNFNFPTNFSTTGAGGGIGQWIQDNMGLFIAIVAAVLLAVIAVVLLVLWLSSRGRFMLIDGIVQNRGAVVEPWREYQKEGNSLFKFRVVLALLWLLLFTVVGGLCFLIAQPDIDTETFGHYATAAIIVGAVFGGGGGLIILMADLMLKDFVTPIMYTFRMTSREAYGLFRREILVNNKMAIFLFYLMKIGIWLAIIIILIVAICLTCCVAAFLLTIPYIGTVAMLPVFVFLRCYSLYMLEQFGSQWKVFLENVCTSCGYDLRGSVGQPTCPECGEPIVYDQPPPPPDDWGPDSLPDEPT